MLDNQLGKLHIARFDIGKTFLPINKPADTLFITLLAAKMAKMHLAIYSPIACNIVAFCFNEDRLACTNMSFGAAQASWRRLVLRLAHAAR